MNYDRMTTPELEEEVTARSIPGYEEQVRTLLIKLLQEDDRKQRVPVTRTMEPIVEYSTPEEPTEEPVEESPQQIIDLTEYVNMPNQEGMRAEYELSGKTGPIPLDKFLSYFPPGISRVGVNKYDIIRTDDYRDNGLYFVYGRNGQRYVIQTPGDYLLPEEALPMLQQHNVRTQDDFYRVYGVQSGELDLFGIELVGKDFPFAEDEDQIQEGEFYDPDNLPKGISIPVELRPTTYQPPLLPQALPKITLPPLVLPRLEPAPSPRLPKFTMYEVPSFLGTKKTKK